MAETACQSKSSDTEDQDNTQMETEDSFADLTDSVDDGSENQQEQISKDTIAHLICSNASKRSRKDVKQEEICHDGSRSKSGAQCEMS